MWRSAKVLLVTSILFSATTISYYWQEHGINFLSGALILGAGLVYGLALSIGAYLLTKFLEFSLKNFLVVLLVLGVVGFGVGQLILGQVYQIPHGNWSPTQGPSEKPIKFLANSPFNLWGGTLYVETDQGNIFSHTCDSENPCSWKKETSIPKQPTETLWTCRPSYKGPFPVPPAPGGRVVDTREVNVCGADYTIQINFILLEDGAIWEWARFDSILEGFSRFFRESLRSFVIGLVGALVLLVGKTRGSPGAW